MAKSNLNPGDCDKNNEAPDRTFLEANIMLPNSIKALKALKLSALGDDHALTKSGFCNKNIINILLVEDNKIDATIHLKMLKFEKNFKVTHVENITSAIESLVKGEFELILLDLSLPDEEGFSTFVRLSEYAPDIPIIVLTGMDNEELALTIMKNGAQDYILKGNVNRELLNRSIRYAIERYKLLERIYSLSLIDELTGLYNRRAFQIIAERYLKLAKRNKYNMLLFFFDLDNMKKINDNYGHLEGDNAIKNSSTILKETFRDSDLVARMGGDEFIALMFVGDRETSFNAIYSRFKEKVETFNSVNKNLYNLSLSVGGVFCQVDQETQLEKLMDKADIALYEHKKLKSDKKRNLINMLD